jgi:putative FmdB family regulatory protein
MPLYEYECDACGHHLEAQQRMADAPLTKCPKCGKKKLQRLISATAFHLKGGGWYKDLYASSKPGSESSSEPSSAEKSEPGEPGSGEKSEPKAETKSDAKSGTAPATAAKNDTKAGDSKSKKPSNKKASSAKG